MLMEGKSYKEVIEFMDSRDETYRDNPFASMTQPTAEHSATTEE